MRRPAGSSLTGRIGKQPCLPDPAVVPGSHRGLAADRLATATGSDAIVLAHPSPR